MPDWYKPVAREAWVLSTAGNDSLRDGGRAIRLAQQAISLRATPDAYLQLVLAAALAESGQFGAAAAEAENALGLLAGGEDQSMAAEIHQSRTQFQQGRPLRQQAEESNR
jgi:hypothetical protein